MKPKIFIDGSEGTTGLQIHDRLSGRDDIQLLHIEPSMRKDIAERKKLLNCADLVFLCLPDEAAREAVGLITNPNVRVIDPSSAHRVASGWVYGLPELSNAKRDAIVTAKRVSNPGCHSTGAILLLAPLVGAGLVSPESCLSITSLTGYTGGGKVRISEYEEADRSGLPELNAPRLYSTGACHKHIPEIMKYTGLTAMPAFLPVIADFPQGMQVIAPLSLPGKRREVFDVLADRYGKCKNIEVTDAAGVFSPSNAYAGFDNLLISVLGFDDMVILTAQFDNLGKGAAGAAVQNMNLMLGFEEYEGLLLN